MDDLIKKILLITIISLFVIIILYELCFIIVFPFKSNIFIFKVTVLLLIITIITIILLR